MKKITVSSEHLKLWALMTMTADHIDKILTHTTWISDTIGRMAFPIFGFLLISHFCTNPLARKKYIWRLGLFGLLTEALLMIFQPDTHNVLLTFLYAVIFLAGTEKVCQATSSLFWQIYVSGLLFLLLLPLIILSDYSLIGFFFLIALYAYFKGKTRLNKIGVLVSGAFLNFGSIMAVCTTLITLIALMDFIQIRNGKRLIKWWGFYLYYPLHRLFLYSVKVLGGFA